MSESASGEADISNAAGTNNSTVCPTCGRDDFRSENGMKVHHYQAHGESIAFVTVECAWCGSQKEQTEGQVRRKDKFFCDTDCKAEWQSAEWDIEDHPTYDGGKVSVSCYWCGDERELYPSQAQNREHAFCLDTDCRKKWRSKNFSAEKSPRWKGGYGEYYGPNWDRKRRETLRRDQYRCRECGATEKALGRVPSVHHRKPLREFKDEYDAPEWYEKGNDLSNLITLCETHHKKWEQMPVQPEVNNE